VRQRGRHKGGETVRDMARTEVATWGDNRGDRDKDTNGKKRRGKPSGRDSVRDAERAPEG
jgi:hypothetical protein